MMPDEPVSRSEFDDLRRHVEMIDMQGSRGVTGISVQISELIKDVSKVERALEEHIASHVTNRRYAVSMVFVILSAIAGLYPLIYFLLERK
jgi:hypothetical protein